MSTIRSSKRGEDERCLSPGCGSCTGMKMIRLARSIVVRLTWRMTRGRETEPTTSRLMCALNPVMDPCTRSPNFVVAGV